MSLFKLRNFWSTECDVDEKFDQSSLEVSKLNGETDKIIVGSQSGILRIFEPSTELDENEKLKNFKPTDLLIEKIFSDPILQVTTGRLVSGSTSLHIAILHPKRIVVHSLYTKEGVAEYGVQNTLKLMYEHKLHRAAANFVVGSFGGSQSRDFVCVQSLDGLLTFLEQESFAFCCFLPNFLLPGPLVYIPKTDSFVTIGANWRVESFKYKRLSEAGQHSNESDSVGVKVECDWSFNLGEGATDIQTLVDINKEAFIVILGEKNIFCVNENGKLKFMKKLEFSTTCFYTYMLDDTIPTVLLISSTNTLLIYQHTTVKWSAQLSVLPISIRRANFKNINGSLVLLSEEGMLYCCYLGTEPQLFAAPPLAYQELDFEKAESELTSLNRIIRSYYSGDTKLTNTSAERELQVTVTVNPHLEPCTFNSLNTEEPLQICYISVELIPQSILEETQISVTVQKPLKCTKEVEFYSTLTQKSVFESCIHLNEPLEVSNLEFTIMISYISNLGVPRVIKKTGMLPLRLVMITCSPSKENEHKITININQDQVPLTTIFPEFMGENSLSLTSNAIGFKAVHEIGSPVTVLLAKNSQRYRLQSDSFISLSIFVQQLVYRLNKHSCGSEFKISYTSSLPTESFINYVKNHFEKRKTVNRLQSNLSQLGGQFRIIQKRLISKFKDKNPTPLMNLEKLLRDTYTEITNVASELETELNKLIKAQNDLSCALQLLLNLIKLMDINKDLLPTLETAFSSAVYDVDGQNWEDTFDVALCDLLRTILAKSEKDKIKAAYSSFDEISDISKVEKHIVQVLERVAKHETNLNEENNLQSAETDEKDPSTNKARLLPIGSQIGQSSSRILSAKKGFQRKRQEKLIIVDDTK